MKWYDGGISDAIVYSKSKGAVFVVYIEGTDEKSQKITDLIDNGELGQKLEQNHFVAVKLEAGSTAHRQFSEIYKEPSVPSLYFIGKNGVPLDIITGNNNLDEVSCRVDDILSRAGISVPSVQSITASVLSDNFIKHEQSSGSPRVECENNVCKIVDDKHAEGEPSQTKPVVEVKEDNDIKPEQSEDVLAEDKIERAKELIELKRQQKEKEEKEDERLKELERRKMGQNVQQLKKWQEDQELRQLKEERDREKRENQLARERVLAQIAQDRAERLSRSQATSKVVESPKVSQSPPKSASNITRLQFKLPDGSSVTQEFQNSDTLECVVSYIRSSLHITLSNFTLATTFPRKEFTKSDYPTTLLDLELVPNAVILVLPTSNGAVTTNSEGGFITSLIWGLLTPIFSIFGYIKSWVFGPNPRRNTRPPPNEPVEGTSSAKRRVSGGDSSTVVRRQGNIHRLTDRNDSDDENNTWNGNSTQQM